MAIATRIDTTPNPSKSDPFLDLVDRVGIVELVFDVLLAGDRRALDLEFSWSRKTSGISSITNLDKCVSFQ